MKPYQVLTLALSAPLVLLLVGGLLWVIPAYHVYSSEQDGKAILAKAEYSRQAQVADAQAKLDSAKFLKQAADEIESSLSPAYLAYLQIQMQEEVASKNDRAVYFLDSKVSPTIQTNSK